VPEIIKLTSKAQKQAKELLDKEKAPKDGLRIAVIGGGCSGLRYQLGFDEPKETDTTHEYENGLVVFIDDKSALYLVGSELEFHDDINRCGFEVTNPNATTRCGCGESFS
jgi:iron-sulfur cluster assembly protein